VRLEYDKADDALYMAKQIVGDSAYHAEAKDEYAQNEKEGT
jgi:hypothetical protein